MLPSGGVLATSLLPRTTRNTPPYFSVQEANVFAWPFLILNSLLDGLLYLTNKDQVTRTSKRLPNSGMPGGPGSRRRDLELLRRIQKQAVTSTMEIEKETYLVGNVPLGSLDSTASNSRVSFILGEWGYLHRYVERSRSKVIWNYYRKATWNLDLPAYSLL